MIKTFKTLNLRRWRMPILAFNSCHHFQSRVDLSSSLSSFDIRRSNKNNSGKNKDDDDQQHSRLKRKTVKFSHRDFVLVPSRKEYSVEELSGMFLSKQDRLRIQEDRRITLQAMEQDVYPDNDMRYFRGLEVGLGECNRDNRCRVRAARTAILETQAYHTIQGGMIDPIWIEFCYRKITHASTITAHRNGYYDALQSSKNQISKS
jgi:hypothetical protein